MATCASFRCTLPRAVEGEMTPTESLRLARHLPHCTACRIRLARERRLAELLDAIEDILPVDSGFAEGVMGALPEGPPPAPVGGMAKLRRRGLKLVGLVALIGAAAGLVSRLASLGGGGGSLPGLPRFSFEGMESLLQVLGGAVRLVMLALARAGSGLGPELPLWSGASGPGYAALVPVLLAVVMLCTALAIATGGYAKGQLIPRAFTRFLSAGSARSRRFAAADRSPRSSVSTRRT